VPQHQLNQKSKNINNTNKLFNKNSAISRIKAIQEKDWKEWENIGVSTAGRPGTANIVKRRDQERLNSKEIVRNSLKYLINSIE